MKKVFFILFCLLPALVLHTQNSYTEAIQQGDAAFKKGLYKTAINKYFAAEAFDPSKKEVVKGKVNVVFDKIEALRDEAITAKNEAEKQAELTLQAKRLIEEEKNRANRLLENMINRSFFDELNTTGHANMMLGILNNLEHEIRNCSGIDTLKILALKYLKGDLYRSINDYEKALEEADEIIKFDSLNIAARSLRLVCYYRTNRNEEGLQEANYILRYDPTNIAALMNKPLMLCHSGNYKEAKAPLTYIAENSALLNESQAVEINEIAPEITSATGSLSFHIHGYDYKKVLQLFGATIPSFEGEVSFYTKIDEKLAGNSNLEIAFYAMHHMYVNLKGIPKDYGGYLALAYLWMKCGFKEQAVESLQLFINKHKDIKDNRYDNLNKNIPKSLTQLLNSKLNRAYPEIDKNLTFQHYIQGIKHSVSERYFLSKQSFEKAMELESGKENLVYNQFRIQAMLKPMYSNPDTNNLEVIIQDLDRLIFKFPESSTLISNRGWAKYLYYLSGGRKYSPGEIMNDFDQVLKVNRYNIDANYFYYAAGPDDNDYLKRKLVLLRNIFHSDPTQFAIINDINLICRELNITPKEAMSLMLD